MNKQVLVSIFCYNVEEFIYNVLENFYKSNSKDISIILINDYSTDKTLYEVKKFINKFNTKNIEIINNSKNMGYGYNYKISFDYAIRNDFTKIIFLHGDG